MAQVKRDQGLAFLAYTAEVSSAQDELPLPIPIALFSFFFLYSIYFCIFEIFTTNIIDYSHKFFKRPNGS